MAKNQFTKRIEYGTVRSVLWHPKAKAAILVFPEEVRREFGYLLYLLQTGAKLHMPQSRPMKIISPGVDELRVQGRDGIYRTFYYAKSARGIFVFHAFKKTTQATSATDVSVGKKRFKEMLEGYHE